MMKNRISIVCLLLGASLLAPGCPRLFPPAFDAAGDYIGTWMTELSNEGCEITMKLTQERGGLFDIGDTLDGEVTFSFDCIPLGNVVAPLLGLGPVPVEGIVGPQGRIVLASDDITGECVEGTCFKIVLEAQGADSDNNGKMDTMEGTWAGAIIVNNTPLPITGTFEAERK